MSREAAFIGRRAVLVRSAVAATSLGVLALPGAAEERERAGAEPARAAQADLELVKGRMTAEYGVVATYASALSFLDADVTTPAATRDVVKLVARSFQAHHRDHAAALADWLESEGATPAEDQSLPELPTGFDDPTTPGVLKLAADLEKHAAVTCTELTRTLESPGAGALVASLGAIDAQHFVVLHALIAGLLQVSATTAQSPELVVPTSFVLDVGTTPSQSLDGADSLDAMLALTPAA